MRDAAANEVEVERDHTALPPPEDEDLEGDVVAITRAFDRHHRMLNPPWDLARGLNFRLRRGDPCIGPRGCIVHSRYTITLARRIRGLAWWLLIHEMTHHFAKLRGWRQPHDEARIDALAARLWVRRRAVLRAVEVWGWDVPRLAWAFGLVPAWLTFRRIAEETGALVIGRDGAGKRFAFGQEWHQEELHASGDWERAHLRAALAGAREPFLYGGEVAPFLDPVHDRQGAAILWPGEAEVPGWSGLRHRLTY